MAIVTGKGAKVKFTSATYSTAAAEAFTSISATTDRTEFRITDGTKRHWARVTSTGGPKPPLMVVNTTAHVGDFATNYVQGKVTFDPALTTAEGDAVTGTVYWVTASFLPWTRSFTADIQTDMLDVTSFSTTTGIVQWRSFVGGLSGATIDLGQIVPSGPATTGYTPRWFDRINTDQDVIVELHMASTYKFEGYARVAGDSWNVSVDALQTEDVTLTVDGPLYFATTE